MTKLIKITILFLFLFIMTQTVIGASTDNLIAYWSLNESGNQIVNSISSGNTLGKTGSPVFTTGVLNGAYGLIGSGGAGTGTNLLTNASLSIDMGGNNHTFCLSWWAKWNTTQVSQGNTYNFMGFGTVANYFGITGYGTTGFQIQATGLMVGALNVVNNGRFNHYVLCQDGTGNITLYENATLKVNNVSRNQLAQTVTHFYIGTTPNNAYGNNQYTVWDNFGLWNRTLSQSEINELWNSGNGLSYPFYSVGSNITITNADIWNSSPTQNITAVICNGATCYTYANGTGERVTTEVLSNNTVLWNITSGATGYYNRTFTNINVSSGNYVATLYPLYHFFNVTYYNLSSFGGVNYSRNLSYLYYVSCPSWATTNVSFMTNESGSYLSNNTVGVTCNNETASSYSGSYQGATEGFRGAYFFLNTTPATSNFIFGNVLFTQDLNSPTATGNFTRQGGFTNWTTNVSARCYDTIFPNLNYTMTFNGNVLRNLNYSNNTHIWNTTSLAFGLNTLNVTCKDPFSSSTYLEEETTYPTTLYLIDEKDNAAFNLDNITGARVYYDDNSSYYDFKTNNKSSVNFTGIGTEKLRFELTYADAAVITRYVDVTLFNNSAVRVCANKEGTTHYEQLIISSSIRPVFLKSVFSNCIVAADYTRFAYQDAYLLKAYTIAALYYLYTYDAGTQVILASVDGTVSTYMNIDTLEFSQTTYDLATYGQGLSIESVSNTEVMVAYNNLKNDNVNASITITDISTGTEYLNTVLANPNNFTLYFDWTTLTVDNQTLFEVELTTTDSDGNVNTIKQYMNTAAKVGFLSSGIGIAIAILLTVFGLTMTASRYTLGWFGAAVLIGAVAVLAFSVSAWYINFMMVIDIILLVFVIIVMLQQNYHSVVS